MDMIHHTLDKIEARLKSADRIAETSRDELLKLLAVLKAEIKTLSDDEADHVESIAGLVNVSTHEATRRQHNPQLFDLSIRALAASVKGFEGSHPKLVESVNALCMTLSNLGI